MKKFAFIFLLLSLASARAADGPPDSPEMKQALADLVSDSFTAREAAQHRLQLLMAQSYADANASRDLLIRLSTMLKEPARQDAGFTAATTQPARLTAIAESQYALSRFAAVAVTLPKDRQDALLQWALTDEGFKFVTMAYGPRPEKRADAGKELSKSDSPQALWMIVQMINDDDREVELAGVDAAWDKKPTPELLDALWNRAIFSLYAVRRNTQRAIMVRGRQIQLYDPDYSSNYRMQDVAIVCDLLIKQNDPAIKQRLVAFIKDLSTRREQSGDYQLNQLVMGQSGDNGAMFHLIQAYKPREIVPLLMKLLADGNSSYGQLSTNGKIYRISTRIGAAAVILQIAGEDPAKFGITQPMQERWAVEGNEDAENKLMDDMKKWWAAHSKEFPG